MKLRFRCSRGTSLGTPFRFGAARTEKDDAPRRTLHVRPRTTVAADSGLQPLARYAAEYLGCEVRNGVAGNGAVVLTLDAADGGNPEAYRLDITPEYIRIGGSTYGGVFNGVQQLFRLLPPEVYARKGVAAGTQVACAEIEDAPRFAYRGMMLDVARSGSTKLK